MRMRELAAVMAGVTFGMAIVPDMSASPRGVAEGIANTSVAPAAS